MKTMYGFRPHVLLLAAAAAFCLVGCASITPDKMVADKPSYGSHYNHTIALNVTGGTPGVKWFSGTVEPEEFQEAIRRSIESSKLFSQFTDKVAADYLLSVNLNYAGSHPGFNMTAWINTTWILSSRASGKSIWTNEVATEGKATVGEAFNGGARQFMALERAVKANIETALTQMGALKLDAP